MEIHLSFPRHRAVRGDIGLMSYSLSLFLTALATLVTVQSLLMWCSRLSNYPFSTPLLWEFILGAAVYGSCAAVVAAIVFLGVTVLKLGYDEASVKVAMALAAAALQAKENGVDAPTAVPCPDGALNGPMVVHAARRLCNLDVFGSNYVPGDAHLTFGVKTEYPAILAFAVSLLHPLQLLGRSLKIYASVTFA